MNKFTILILLLSCLQGCLSFGDEKDFEVNSAEGISLISRVLKIEPSLISEVHYHKNEVGIDPYYHAKFKINPNDFDRHIVLTDLTKDSITNVKDQPNLNSPAWFNTPATISSSYSKEIQVCIVQYVLIQVAEQLISCITLISLVLTIDYLSTKTALANPYSRVKL